LGRGLGERNLLAVVREEEETVEDDKEKQSRERRCHHAGAPADRQFTLFASFTPRAHGLVLSGVKKHLTRPWLELDGGTETLTAVVAQ
jgi:hypothetical protein